MTIDWGEWTAIGTLALAAVTFLLAVTTVIATIVNNRQFDRSRRDSERHHQEGSRPVVVLVPKREDKADQSDIGNGFIHVMNNQQMSSSPQEANLSVRGYLCNIGAGPALNICLTLLPASDLFTKEMNITVRPLGNVNESNHTSLSFTGILREEQVATQKIQGAINEGWHVIIEYEDVFENCYRTIHTSDQSKPWVEFSSAGRTAIHKPRWIFGQHRQCHI